MFARNFRSFKNLWSEKDWQALDTRRLQISHEKRKKACKEGKKKLYNYVKEQGKSVEKD